MMTTCLVVKDEKCFNIFIDKMHMHVVEHINNMHMHFVYKDIMLLNACFVVVSLNPTIKMWYLRFLFINYVQ